MKRLGYIRTSTDGQCTDRQHVQLRDLCDELFVEDGVSAISKKRPIYKAVLKRLGRGDMLIVSSLDRAFRSTIDALNELEKLHKRGIQFVSVSQNFDTSTPDGKFLYTLAAALATWERDILSQRTKEGLRAAKQRGKTLGRPRKLTSQQIIQAKRHINNGGALSDLADSLCVSERTLVRALTKA